MNLIIESNFECCEIWTQKSDDFKQFLLKRKKRLSATFILICDYCLNNFAFSNEKLDLIDEIGSIVEIISITGHDLVKRKEKEPNVYEFWLGKGGNKEKQAFLDEIKKVLVEKKNGFREWRKIENKEEIKEILRNVGEVLKNYYKFEEVDELLKFVMTEERAKF